MRFKLALVGLLTAVFLVVASPALAVQHGQPTWEEALHFAVGPGSAVLASLIISIGIEFWPAFQALGQKYKVATYIVLCIGIALAGTTLAIATHVWGSWNDIQTTWWPALWAGFAASGIGTLFHAWVPAPLRQSKE